MTLAPDEVYSGHSEQKFSQNLEKIVTVPFMFYLNYFEFLCLPS